MSDYSIEKLKREIHRQGRSLEAEAVKLLTQKGWKVEIRPERLEQVSVERLIDVIEELGWRWREIPDTDTGYRSGIMAYQREPVHGFMFPLDKRYLDYGYTLKYIIYRLASRSDLGENEIALKLLS